MDAVFWSIVLLLLGLALIVLEIFVPSGGVLSVLAAVSVVAAIIVGFTGGSRLGAGVLAAAAVLAPLVVALAVRWWPHTPLGRMMLILRPDGQEQVLPDSEAYGLRERMIGKRGAAKSKMLPSGAVVIEGSTYDAISEGPPIEAGQAIEVVAVRTNRIIVRPAPALRAADDDVLSRPIESIAPDPFEEPLA